MSGLILPNGHRSASQRREQAIDIERDFYTRVAAALIVREGGSVLIPHEALHVPCKMGVSMTEAGVTIAILEHPDAAKLRCQACDGVRVVSDLATGGTKRCPECNTPPEVKTQ